MARQLLLCPICLDEILDDPADTTSSKKIDDGKGKFDSEDKDMDMDMDDLQQVEVPTTTNILSSDDDHDGPFDDVKLGKKTTSGNEDDTDKGNDPNNSMCISGSGSVSSTKSGGTTGKPNDLTKVDLVKVDGCGHIFCRACMQDYITVQLDDQRQHTGSKLPVCPMGGCSNTLPTDWIMEKVLLSATSDD